MKRSLLFLLIGVLFVASGYAQSFVIKDKSGVDVTGQTISQFFAPGESDGAIGLDVFNVSASAKNVKVKRLDISLVDSTLSYFCWALCYPDWITESPDPVLIESGSFVTNFTGDIQYRSIQGTSRVRYTFFDADNRQDSSFVILDYIVGTLGIESNFPERAEIIGYAYPNPANSFVSFNYDIPSSSTGAKVKITSLLGTVVDEIQLDKTEGKANINVSNLKNGIYFYSLMLNNSAAITRKFVVKR